MNKGLEGDEVVFAIYSEELGSVATTDFGDCDYRRCEAEGFHERGPDKAVVETSHVFLVGPLSLWSGTNDIVYLFLEFGLSIKFDSQKRECILFVSPALVCPVLGHFGLHERRFFVAAIKERACNIRGEYWQLFHAQRRGEAMNLPSLLDWSSRRHLIPRVYLAMPSQGKLEALA